MALASDLQEQLDLLTDDFLKAAADVEGRRVEKLNQFTDPKLYAAPGGPLDLELAVLREDGKAIKAPRLLVLLCGMTSAPLLLSQRFINPEKVLLVGSDTREGRIGVEQVRPHIDAGRLVNPEVEISNAQPELAFTVLFERVRAEMAARSLSKEDVLIDITGGQKTMTAAAFQVASHLDIATVYMDGEFDQRLALPKPGTARPQVLKDPVRHFWLREQAQIQRFVEQDDFHAAALFLRKMEKVKQAERAEAAWLWRDARYQEELDALNGQEPPQVLKDLAGQAEMLANLWPKQIDNPGKQFETPEAQEGLLRFCADRVTWGKREYDRGHLRRGYLDAYSACEALLEVLGKNHKHEHFGNNKPLRLHRHALVHRIQSPNRNYVDQLLQGSPCLAQQILADEAKGLNMISPLKRSAILMDPLAGLAELAPKDLQL